MMANMRLSWNCDYCGKPDLVVSEAGRIYCNNCKKCNPNPQFEAAWDMLNKALKAAATNRKQAHRYKAQG